jgi:charged multivesicular body protein 3
VLAKEVMRARKCHPQDPHVQGAPQLGADRADADEKQLATVRVSGALKKSTEVMASMQSLIRVPEVAATMRDMSCEMMRRLVLLKDARGDVRGPR